MNYSFTKEINSDRLSLEIHNSAIITALDFITTVGTAVTVTFKDTLSGTDENILNGLVSAHAASPLAASPQVVSLVTLPEPQPFAVPAYRTKRDATSDLFECAVGSIVDIDFKLLAERYVTGGELIIENAELGDYIVAAVEDLDGIIPSPYRAALCEAHPIVAKYIDKAWVPVNVAGTIQAGAITNLSIETYPLNAKISAGLYLCIEYHAVSTGLTRRIAVNYHLTKKL